MYGCDYAFYPHPPVSALRTAGAQFVGRYVSPSARADTDGKNLLPGELALLRKGGLSLILYAEQYAGRMLEGSAAGRADAEHFKAVTAALGLDGIAMFCAADFDVQDRDVPAVLGYLDGAAGVIGRGRTAIYGGLRAVRRALDSGKAKYACQTVAWSACGPTYDPPPGLVKVKLSPVDYRLFDTRAQVRQYLTVNIGGAACDRLQSTVADFGQWPRPAGGDVVADAYRHEFGPTETQTLWGWCSARGTTVEAVVEFSRGYLNDENERVLDTYLEHCAALHDAGHPRAILPGGFVCWTRNP